MALGATVHRAELELADIDRGVYGSHTLTLARHPSETEERLMLRLLAWAMFADPDRVVDRGGAAGGKTPATGGRARGRGRGDRLGRARRAAVVGAAA